MDWITCSGCGLKHSPRPDGLCPRCQAPTGAAPSDGARFAQPSFERPTFSAPASPSAPPSGGPGPLPTSAWGGGSPLPTQPVQGTTAALTVGSLLSRTFSAWWANVGRFAVSLLLAYLPVAIAGVAAAIFVGMNARGLGAEEAVQAGPRAMIPFLVVGGVVTFVLVMAQFGGVTFATLQHLAGRRVGIGEIFRSGFRRAWPLLVAGFAAAILIWLGLILLIVPGILLALGLTVVIPVIVAENPDGVGAAFKRSFALTKGSRGAVFGALFVLMLAMWAASLVGNLATAAAATAPAVAFVGLAISVVVQLAMAPLTTVLCAVAYHELRLAKEGVDTSQLAKVFE